MCAAAWKFDDFHAKVMGSRCSELRPLLQVPVEPLTVSSPLAPVLERFHRRREELARELALSGLAPLSFITLRFGKRANRHIIGSQNHLIHLLRGYLEDAIPPLERDQLRNVEDSLNQAPMSYLGVKSPRVALLHCRDTSRNSPTTS